MRKTIGQRRMPEDEKQQRLDAEKACHQLALIALLAVLAVGMVGEVLAQVTRQPFLTYRARQVSGIEALEGTSRTGHWSETIRRPVSDVIVRLRPWTSEPLDRALRAESARPSADRATFAAELIVAASGRLHLEDRAACGPWVGDVAVCRTECDGGAFAIRRRIDSDAIRLSLLIGRFAPIQEAGFGEVVRLAACADSEAASGLSPRSGQAGVEMELSPR